MMMFSARNEDLFVDLQANCFSASARFHFF